MIQLVRENRSLSGIPSTESGEIPSEMKQTFSQHSATVRELCALNVHGLPVPERAFVYEVDLGGS